MADWYERKSDNVSHLVYLDKKAKELEKLLNKTKTMIIRGANGKKCPLGGRAREKDIVYFVEKGSNMLVMHKGVIKSVTESYKMEPQETINFIKKYEKGLNLSKEQYDRWSVKKCLAVYEITNLKSIEPFKYKREANMDDWIIINDINKIKDN